MSHVATEIERTQGRSGELVLRRTAAGLEIIANGVFLVSAANRASSRALVEAAWPHVVRSDLDVLIGGLGIGDALEAALACDRVRHVTVVELEPVIVRWFREHGGGAARQAAAAEAGGRLQLVTADVADVLAEGVSWDVIAQDTDNGPEWLVREENARLWTAAGLAGIRRALRPAGVAVFWSAAPAPAFGRLVAGVFGAVEVEAATDIIDGHVVTCSLYIAARTNAGGAGEVS